MTSTDMLERMDRCADLWIEYLTNVWDLPFDRRSAGSGTIYLTVKNKDLTPFFTIRIADHPPCLEDRDDPRQVNVDPNKEPISALAYAAHRYQLMATEEIRRWDSLNGFGIQGRTKPKESHGEAVALTALMTEVDLLTSRLKESEAVRKGLETEQIRHEHNARKAKESAEALRLDNTRLKAENDSLKTQVKKMSDTAKAFMKEWNSLG